MICNEALEKFYFMSFELLVYLTELLYFCMNFLVQIPAKGIIVKHQIWLSEIEEREGNERWLLSLTPSKEAVVNILSTL